MKTKFSVMYENMLSRPLIHNLGQFQVVLVKKLRKIGKNLLKSAKNFVFEANKSAKVKSLSQFFLSQWKEH